MKTSIATVSLSGSLRDKLEAIAAAYFDGVQIFENDFLTFDGSAREVTRMVSGLGLGITIYQPFHDLAGSRSPRLRAEASGPRRCESDDVMRRPDLRNTSSRTASEVAARFALATHP